MGWRYINSDRMKVHHRKQENGTSLKTGFSYITLRYITDVKWGVHGPCLVALEPGISHPHSVNLTSRPLSQLVFIYCHKFSIQAVLIGCVKCIHVAFYLVMYTSYMSIHGETIGWYIRTLVTFKLLFYSFVNTYYMTSEINILFLVWSARKGSLTSPFLRVSTFPLAHLHPTSHQWCTLVWCS